MKKLFLLFVVAAAMTMVSCSNSGQENSQSSSDEAINTIENAVSQAADSMTVDAAKAEAPTEPTTCSKCGGSGKVSCSKCGGKGYIHKRLRGDDGDWSKDYGCSKCGGSGYRSSEGYAGEHLRKGSGKMTCPECGGSGH
ncbi:MAG: hypothetical protein IKX31_07495 [Muribaculaceae bacterium]|nr:hypothetical protein [Muribaculaceae bacterium]